MKIINIHLEEHPVFGNVNIDLVDERDKSLDIVVFTGVNGSGKTSLLKTILSIMSNQNALGVGLRSELTLESPYFPEIRLVSRVEKDREQLLDSLKTIEEKNRPKIVYMPTEINFDALSVKTLSLTPSYQFVNIVNQDMIADIPSFIASTVNSEVYKNPDLPAKKAIDRICNEINSLFNILEIDARMVGLNPDGEKLPVFKNSADKLFDINGLSSGEKQLFVRAMALRMLNMNHSVILIDEPEISMHPGWQQKIVNVYQGIGVDNQIIIATHSPHIVASVPKESLRLLKRVNGEIKILGSQEDV